ncbi:S-adenosyl-L-methionine-dependent methyltransferase [Xylariaceae sp. FL1272]|nr:S-adenosyl-L-methionine-dependent methyltransferase [Xylariaceae sp. FL1272]
MDSALDQLRTLAAGTNNVERHKVLDAIRNLQLELETPHDTLSRFSGMHLEITAARIGADLGIFKILVSTNQPLALSALSAKTGAAPAVLSRILRYLASVGMIRETEPGGFTSNSITTTLSQPGYEGSVLHFFDNIGPCLQSFPQFLADTKYQDVANSFNTAFQRAFNTDETAFQWLPKFPDRFGPLQQVMTVQGAAGVPWFHVFPFEEELAQFTGPYAFVDCHILSSRFSKLITGKIVLQDLKETIASIQLQLVGFEKMCVVILKQIIPALGDYSQILIDEMVLPDTAVPWEATTIDLTMMASLGARERTLSEWHSLLDVAGLKALRIDTYMARRQDSIIQAIRK